MWFHAITEHPGGKRYWWNRSKDNFIQDIIKPLVFKQVNIIWRGNRYGLFNFSSVSYTTIIKTEKKLERPKPGGIPEELKDKSFIKKHEATKDFVEELKITASSKGSKPFIEQSLSEPLNQIFIIMKFKDKHLNSAYEGVIKPLGEEFGYKVLRVDEIQDSGKITDQILDNIAKSKLIIADLSGERPNCYYESGFAHAIGKEIIFTINKKNNIHFDLKDYRFICWETEQELRNELRKRLESIKERDSK